jgi:hypothetical protein
MVDAEAELQKAIEVIAVAPRSAKSVVSEAVRDALARLNDSRTKIVELERHLALAQLTPARAATLQAERDLDRAIEKIKISQETEKTWITDGVGEAFSKLKAARERLVVLEKLVGADSDEPAS